MSHFAKVIDNIVTQVIVAEQDFIDLQPNLEQWVQTSYNTHGGIHLESNGEPNSDQSNALRYNYAGIGYAYDTVRDAFIPPNPYPSWILNEESCLWDPPIPYPDDGKIYSWDEENQSWIEHELLI